MTFLERLHDRARALDRTLGFAEGDDPRVVAAALAGASAGLFRSVLFGDSERISHALERGGAADLPRGVQVEDVGGTEALEAATVALTESRVDGVVAGAVYSTPDVLRAALTQVGPAAGVKRVSSSFYMIPDEEAGPERVLTFTDAGVNPDPGAALLADIARQAAEARERIVGDRPRVAFLSYSTRGSAAGPSVEKVVEAVERFRTICPDVEADGELQVDAALVPEVAARKAPGSSLGGRANILVFPNLDAANIGYKLVHRLAGGMALGPVLHGLARPMNDLSRGADAREVRLVGCITSLLSSDDSS